MNKKTVVIVAAIVVGFITGVSLFIGAQVHQRNMNAELLLEERRANMYYECTRGLLSWIQYKDGTKKYFRDGDGKWVANEELIKLNEHILKECEDKYGKKDK